MQASGEKQLLKKAVGGDQAAFGELVELYTPRIYSVCFGFLGHRQDAEDCTQETFIKAYRAISRFSFRASFYTWIYRIAINACHDYRRRHHKVTVQSLDREMELDDSSVPFQLADDQPGPLDLAELEETRRMVREAIATLPNYLAEILIMRDLQQMSYQELSDIFDLKAGTVKSRLARARQQLMLELRRREQDAAGQRLNTDPISDQAQRGGEDHATEL